MFGAVPLQPTLWRTCRVLANKTRLRLFQELMRAPGQSVSAAATRLKLPLPVASQYLRAMEARGLLTARRVGLRVYYRPAGDLASVTRELAKSLRETFQRERMPVETIFMVATAFTHPRRIEVFRALNGHPMTFGELRTLTKMSRRALARHLGKLEDRGFVTREHNQFAAVCQSEALTRELARLAIE